MAASPYGFWTSPITSDLVVADSIRLEQVALDGDAIYWTETQPRKQGRTFVYRIGADGEPERVTPDDANAFSIRTRAHEYGGGAFASAKAGDIATDGGGVAISAHGGANVVHGVFVEDRSGKNLCRAASA